MKRDEEILHKELSHISFLFTDDSNLEINIKQSMEEQSINFAHWIAYNDYRQSLNGLWKRSSPNESFTTKELYEIFNLNNK